VAYENVEDAARNGLHYVELRFSPRYMAMTHQLPVDGVVEAVIAGVREGSRDFNVETRLIGILSRTFGEAACQQELDALLAHRDGITALDLAGDELGFPGNLFMQHFARSRCRLAYYRARRRSGRCGASGRLSGSWELSVSDMA
jgi:adenosine deaminase